MPPKTYRLHASEIRTLVPSMGSCIATDRIVVDGAKVGYCYREEPDNDHDSGWRFFAGDEDDLYVEEPDNMALYEVNTVANYDADIIPILDAPSGTAYERDDSGRLVQAFFPVRGLTMCSSRPLTACLVDPTLPPAAAQHDVRRHGEVLSLSKIKTTWAGMHGEGMQLELSCEISGKEQYFARFVADDGDETLHLELVVSGQRIRLPVSQLETLIADAKRDVHSESWYDKNSVGGNDA